MISIPIGLAPQLALVFEVFGGNFNTFLISHMHATNFAHLIFGDEYKLLKFFPYVIFATHLLLPLVCICRYLIFVPSYISLE